MKTEIGDNTNERFINIALIGKPGSGKGTYGALLSQSLNIPLVVLGDVLCDHVQRKTDIGLEIAGFQREGRLADDELVANALLSHLRTMFKDSKIDQRESEEDTGMARRSKFGFILDGFPRTLSQAHLMFPLDKMNSSTVTSNFAEASASTISWPDDMKISFAVNIDIPDEICLAKMLGQRKCTKCNKSFNVADVNTEDGLVMPPKLPSPYPCVRCDMNEDWHIRIDDMEKNMSRRIAEFHEKSASVSKFFEDADKIVTFVPYNGISDMHILEKLVKEKATKSR